MIERYRNLRTGWFTLGLLVLFLSGMACGFLIRELAQVSADRIYEDYHYAD